MAIVSAAVGVALAAIGRLADPSKWSQKPFASTASWKRKTKIAQLDPEALSRGTVNGNVSEREAVMIDIYGEFSLERDRESSS